MADVTVTYDASTAETAAKHAGVFNQQLEKHEKHAHKAKGAIDILSKAMRKLGGAGGEVARTTGESKHMGKAFLAAGLGVMALKMGMEAVNRLSEKAVDTAKELTKQAQERAKWAVQAQQAIGNQGLSAARSNGGEIRSLTAQGKMGEVNKLVAQGFSFKDAADATEKAQLFGSQSGAVLKAAVEASRHTGGSLTSGVEMSGRTHIGTRDAAREIVEATRGRAVSSAEYAKENIRLGHSKTVGAIQKISEIGGQTTLAKNRQIGSGDTQGAARSEMARAIDPLSAKMTEQYQVEQEQLEVMRKGVEAQYKVVAWMQKVFHPGATDEDKYLDALRNQR